MTGLTLAAASIAVGVSIGAAATVGVTLASQDHGVAPVPSPATRAPYLVDYGDRCFHGHCLPCDSKQSCLNKLPPGLRP
jgi:Protein of unknown function (DUF2613)